MFRSSPQWKLAMEGSRPPQLSFVYLASVTDSRHFDQRFGIVDGVHDAVIPHTDTPLFITAFQLLTARRARVSGETFHAWSDARDPLAR